jgi:chemotaxis protein methyltransferase CheR
MNQRKNGRGGERRADPESLDSLEPRVFRAFAKLIYDSSGVRLGDEKLEFLSARLRPLLRALGEPNFPALLRSVRSDETGERLALLLDRVTTNTTGFFRHPVHFDLLRAALPELARTRGKLRIWSAGCATGEEPYSAAIVAAEAGLARETRVLATDISRRALRQARAAAYPSAALANVPPSCRRYFETAFEESVHVRANVRDLVHVRVHDLRELTGFARDVFDAVFCRNVLIYFDAGERAAAIERLAGALRSGGIFFLGPCETGVVLPASFARIGPAAYRKA